MPNTVRTDMSRVSLHPSLSCIPFRVGKTMPPKKHNQPTSKKPTLLEKQPFTTLIARHKRLRRRANARQGRPCHKERRRAFTTLIYDAQLRRAFTTCNAYQGRPCHKGRWHAFACRNLTTRVLMTRNAYQESPCQERPGHK